MWGLAGSAAAAFAATPVVHAGGDAAVVLAQVSARTGVPLAGLSDLPFDQVLGAAPRPVGDGALRPCSGAPVANADVAAAVEAARAAMTAADPDAAWGHLEGAVAALGCLGEQVSIPVAADVFALRADVRTARQDLDGLPSERQRAAAFGQGTAAGDPVPVRLVGAQDDGPWLDGHPLAANGASVSPGLHLFQVREGEGIRSGWLTVGGALSLVVPAGFRSTALGGFGDPGLRRPLEGLLAATVEAPEVYVADGGGVWLVELAVDPVLTLELTPRTPPAPVAPPPTGRRDRNRR